MTLEDPWLATTWPFVRRHLPPPPATVFEIGCGALGGFIPELAGHGYEAVGIDPQAPDGPAYRQVRFEDADVARPVDAIVACTALHHVADLEHVVDRIEAALHPGGTLVLVEWAWERFDEATAQWCFSRLQPATDAEPGWLHRHYERWRESKQPWEVYVQAWARDEGLHAAHRIVDVVDARFTRCHLDDAPYIFRHLADTSEADERSAADRGEITATCLRYVGFRR